MQLNGSTKHVPLLNLFFLGHYYYFFYVELFRVISFIFFKKKSCARKWRRRRRLCFQFNVPVYFCVCVYNVVGYVSPPLPCLYAKKLGQQKKPEKERNDSFRFLYINMFKAKLKINRYPELYPTYLKNSGILWRRCCLCHASRPSAEFCRRRKLSIFLLPSPFPTRPPPPCN